MSIDPHPIECETPPAAAPKGGKVIQMTISGSGVASNGLSQIAELTKSIEALDEDDSHEVTELKDEFDLGMADCAISCLHDGLLAVCKGMITPDQARDFFWAGDNLDKVDFIGTVLKFNEKPTT